MPDAEAILAMMKDGKTQADVAADYGVHQSAVSNKISRWKTANRLRRQEAVRHADFIPWSLGTGNSRRDYDHRYARLLRAYSRRVQDGDPAYGGAELDEWLRWMDGGNEFGVPMVVCYDPDRQPPFWVEPAKPGDIHYTRRS